MNTALRWIIATVGWLALLIVYAVWRDVEKHTGGGFITGFLRGAIVFGGAFYLYNWAKNDLLPHPPQPPYPTHTTSPRSLCREGNCIGIIGTDGLCKECGMPLAPETPTETSVETVKAQANPNNLPPLDGGESGPYFVFRCHFSETENKNRLVELICPSEEVFLAIFNKRKLNEPATWSLTEDDEKYNRTPLEWKGGSLPVGGSWVDCYANIEGARESFRRNAQGVLETKRKSPIEPARVISSPELGKLAPNQRDAIWNPNAIVNWCFIFTPAFGSYLQMLNWKALGELEKAESSKNWFYASLAMLAVILLMGAFMSDPKAVDNSARGLAFLYLLVWYFSVGRSQGKFVKEKFGSNYPKKPWGKALFAGTAAIIGYFAFAVVVGLILGAASSKTETANPFSDPNFGKSAGGVTEEEMGLSKPASDNPEFGKATALQANQPEPTQSGPRSNTANGIQQRSERIQELYEAQDYYGVIREAESGQYLAEYANILGVSLYTVNQFDRAILVFQQAEKAFPSNAILKCNLGDAYLSSGYLALALTKYCEAHNLDSTNETFQQRITNIQNQTNLSSYGYSTSRVTINFNKLDIHKAFLLFSEISGIKINVEKSIQGTLTLSLNNIPWDLALDVALNMNNLAKRNHADSINISKRPAN